MTAYRIRPGDTLSALAVRNHTSVAALLKANPGVKNANLIFAGQTLQVPGKRDEFVPAQKTAAAARPAPASSSSARAFAIAQSYLGWNAGALKVSGNAVGKAMADWVPNTVNCANFVSGVLEAAGQIPHRLHDDSVNGLMHKLDADPQFARVTLAHAQPGDVVSFRTPGNGRHVELFAGWENGRPKFIGSNNVNADGTQRVSWSHASYEVLAVHHYRG